MDDYEIQQLTEHLVQIHQVNPADLAPDIVAGRHAASHSAAAIYEAPQHPVESMATTAHLLRDVVVDLETVTCRVRDRWLEPDGARALVDAGAIAERTVHHCMNVAGKSSVSIMSTGAHSDVLLTDTSPTGQRVGSIWDTDTMPAPTRLYTLTPAGRAIEAGDDPIRLHEAATTEHGRAAVALAVTLRNAAAPGYTYRQRIASRRNQFETWLNSDEGRRATPVCGLAVSQPNQKSPRDIPWAKGTVLYRLTDTLRLCGMHPGMYELRYDPVTDNGYAAALMPTGMYDHADRLDCIEVTFPGLPWEDGFMFVYVSTGDRSPRTLEVHALSDGEILQQGAASLAEELAEHLVRR